MVQEAQEHSAEDRKKREKADARNELESLSYQLEKTLKEKESMLEETQKVRVRNALEEAKALAKNSDATLENLRVSISELQQTFQTVMAAKTPGTSGGEEKGSSKEDVVDAEFIDPDEKNES